jgi:transposase
MHSWKLALRWRKHSRLDSWALLFRPDHCAVLRLLDAGIVLSNRPGNNWWNRECQPWCSVALGRPMLPLILSYDEVQQLQSLAHSRSLPHSIVQRAQTVLASGAGETNTAIARRMGLTGMTVGKWRKCYRDLGLEGLHDEHRPGRPRTYEDDRAAEMINRALQTKPADGSTQLSACSLAADTGISKTTVHRWLENFSAQPHRQKSHRFAEDLRFQVLYRSTFCREGPRHRRTVSQLT